LENRRAEQFLSGGLAPVEGGGCMEILCKYCVHVCVNGKMRLVETIPGMGKEVKGKFKYEILDIL
jgi:hypothetical protein